MDKSLVKVSPSDPRCLLLYSDGTVRPQASGGHSDTSSTTLSPPESWSGQRPGLVSPPVGLYRVGSGRDLEGPTVQGPREVGGREVPSRMVVSHPGGSTCRRRPLPS